MGWLTVAALAAVVALGALRIAARDVSLFPVAGDIVALRDDTLTVVTTDADTGDVIVMDGGGAVFPVPLVVWYDIAGGRS